MTISNSSELVVVDGATGYLGTHLINRLTSLGYKTRSLVRAGARKQDVELLAGLGSECHSSPDGDGEKGGFEGASCAVHLIGSIAPQRGESFESLHTEATRQFVRAACAAGVKKLIHVTALGSAANAPSAYHRSKFSAEEVVRNSGLDYTILRPSLLVGHVIGTRDSKLIKRLLEIIGKKPVVPLINGGVNKLQPLFIGDMVDAVAACLGSDYNGETLELGGPNVVTMRQIAEMLQEIVGRKKPIINLPPALGKLMAGAMEAVQDVPTLSRDQVVLSLSDNICQANRLADLIGKEAVSLETALSTYRSHDDPKKSREPLGMIEER